MHEEEEETNSLRDLIQNLTANMESNFAKLHEELCGLRQEMKEEIDMLKSNIKGVEKSVGEIWATIEDMKEATIGVRAGGAGGAAAPPVSKIFGQNAKNSGNKETINDGIEK